MKLEDIPYIIFYFFAAWGIVLITVVVILVILFILEASISPQSIRDYMNGKEPDPDAFNPFTTTLYNALENYNKTKKENNDANNK